MPKAVKPRSTRSIRFYKGEWQVWSKGDQSWSGRIAASTEQEAIQCAADHWGCKPEEVRVVADREYPKQKKVADNIYKIFDKNRTLTFRVHIFYKNKQHVVMCRTLEEAKIKRDEKWTYLRKPKELQEIDRMEGTPVNFLVMKYSKYVENENGDEIIDESGDKIFMDDFLFISGFCNLPIAKKSIYEFDRKDSNDYIKKRLSDTYTRKGWKEPKPILPSSVEREVTTLKAIWNAAKNSGDYPKLDNPWTGHDIAGSKRISTRTLEHGELEKLLEASTKRRGLNQIYIPLAIYICLDTALRRQEIFNLKWEDIDFENRTIRIRQSKTDKENVKKGLPPGRWIVLTFDVGLYLLSLRSQQLIIYSKQLEDHKVILDKEIAVLKTGKIPRSSNKQKPVLPDRVFPLTPDGGDPALAFKQVWQDLRKDAGIEEVDGAMLEFRHLRKAAKRRFVEADLNSIEQNMQMGHAFEGMDEVYLDKHARTIMLNRIRDKLDRLVLGGYTLAELQEKAKTQTEEQKDEMRRQGMTNYIQALQSGVRTTVLDHMTIPEQWRNLLSVVSSEQERVEA